MPVPDFLFVMVRLRALTRLTFKCHFFLDASQGLGRPPSWVLLSPQCPVSSSASSRLHPDSLQAGPEHTDWRLVPSPAQCPAHTRASEGMWDGQMSHLEPRAHCMPSHPVLSFQRSIWA